MIYDGCDKIGLAAIVRQTPQRRLRTNSLVDQGEMLMNTKFLLGTASALLLGEAVLLAAPAVAQLDEIIVTARKTEESLQDVPVTVTAFDAATIDRWQIDNVNEIADFTPNFRIQNGGSGSGGTLILRGVGSSAISAAFDSAVAFNIDGVSANTMRLVQNAFLDMEQVEVLKGPQSLYFGKSASAGVISIRSANPGDEFEAQGKASYEFEEKGYLVEGFVSGPITDEFGARYAIRYNDISEVEINTAPTTSHPEHEDESLDMRLTLTWDPSENWSSNFKAAWSQFEGSNPVRFTDILCVTGVAQPTVVLRSAANPAGVSFPSGYDCDPVGDTVQHGDMNPLLSAGLPGGRGGVPFEEQDTILMSLTNDWDITDTLTLTSVTGYYDLDNKQNGCFSYDINGFGCNLADNTTKSYSQELRLAGSLSDSIDFLAGAYYQQRDILFQSYQYAINIALVTPDPITGQTSDYFKSHRTDTEAYSFFGALTAEITDDLSLQAGARWSHENKQNSINIPYVHAALPAALFLPSGTLIDGIEFSDDNFSPEASLTWSVTDDINLYAAYKTGFKSGGIDNSALPTGSLATAAASGDFSNLIFQSETAAGYEGGVKATLLDGSMRVNASAFKYVFDDLQVQQFLSAVTQFRTFNAGELTSQGAEVDMLWAVPNMEGLVLNGALAYTDAKFTDTFVNADLDDLNGRQKAASSKWSGNFGASYEYLIPNSSLLMAFGGTAHYNSKYNVGDALDAPIQDSFWRGDLFASIEDDEGLWKLAFIGQNISDKIYTITGGGRPFTSGVGGEDQVMQNNRGRLLTIEGTVNF